MKKILAALSGAAPPVQQPPPVQVPPPIPTQPPPTLPLPGPIGLGPLKLAQLIRYVEQLLLQFGPAALPYIMQLLASLPLSPSQSQLIQGIIKSILAMLGVPQSMTAHAAGKPFMEVDAMRDFLAA
jgi:hypothetical protein